MKKNRAAKLIFLFVVAFLLFNYPLLEVAERTNLLWGIPYQYFYFFMVWGIIIIFLFGIVEKVSKNAK